MGELESVRIGILASGDREGGGGGSTADQLARDTLEGKVSFKIGVVVCNNPRGTVGVYDRFDEINRHFGLKGDDKIEVVTVNGTLFSKGFIEKGHQTQSEAAEICRLFEERDIGFAAMVGYMKIADGQFVKDWFWKPRYGITDPTFNGIYHPKARTSNNHPAILPWTVNTHGPGAHQRAVDLRDEGVITQTAMTWHLGAAAVDTGPVFAERLVPIEPNDTADTLGARVQADEKKFTGLVLQEHLLKRQEHLRAYS